MTGTFELTARCNLQCRMCYVCRAANDRDAMRDELTANQWIRLAEEARDQGLLYVTLTGGEVFLRKDFPEIYRQLCNLGLYMQIFTNGTLITPAVVDWLSRIPPMKVSITLYGASRETCARVTGFADSYDRTVRAIDLLLDAGIKTEVKTTVVQGNRQDFDALSEFAQVRGLPIGVVNYISPRREGMNSNPEGNRLSPAELIDYEQLLEDRNRQLRESGEGSSDFSDAFDASALQEIAANMRPNDDHPFRCASGRSAAWFSWNGKLIPCGLMSEPRVDFAEDGVERAWDVLKAACAVVPNCSECLACKYSAYCHSCPGRRLTESGRPDKAAPYLCDAAVLRYNQQIGKGEMENHETEKVQQA